MVLCLEASKGIEVLPDDHGTCVGPWFTKTRHLCPLSAEDVKLADFVSREAMGEISADHVDMLVVVIASERGSCIRNLLTLSYRVVFKVPLLDFVADLLCAILRQATAHDEDSVSWHENGSPKKQ